MQHASDIDKGIEAGLADVIACTSSISLVDGASGRLLYRGYDIAELAEQSSFEEVAYLLWFGRLPGVVEFRAFLDGFSGSMKMPVETVLNAYPDWRIPGEVIAIIPAADRGKATVKVRVALKEKDARIVPDMGVRVSFLEAAPAPGETEKPQGVRVPAAAIVQREGADVAFVVGGEDTVEQRAVKTGIAMGQDRQVLSGLAAGETVVLDAPETLQDGDTVRLAGAGDTE